MSRRTMWLLPLLFVAAACERPTAPEAHNIARQTERRFADGDFDGIGNMFVGLSHRGMSGGFAHQIRQTELNRAMQISRDGRTESISGFVIEEVLIAPGNVGRPRVRRTLIGWPDDFGFAVHATTDAEASYMAFQTDSAPRLSARSGITIRHRRSTSWRGLSGRVAIGDPLIDAPCETAKETPLRMLGYTEAGTRCDFALYEVDVYGDLVVPGKGDGPLGKLFERRQIIRIAPQRVPGMRFTVQCPDSLSDAERLVPQNPDCAFPMRFWANNDLFAPELGVDVAQMRAPAGEGPELWYVQTFAHDAREGSGPFRTRWKIHTPGGGLVEADSAGVDRPARRDLDAWFMRSQFDIKAARIRALIPATAINPAASRFDVLVLDLEMERQVPSVRAGSGELHVPRLPHP